MSEITLLNGKWSFSLDPENNQQWHKITDQLPEQSITIPGSWEEQGYGEPSDHNPIGTWKKAREYEGIVWYVKDVDIPSAYACRKIYLQLKGVRWVSKLWIDGKFVGKEDSLVTPHSYDITKFVKAGQSHRFTIQLDNQMRYSLHESHIHSYHTATNWGGITGGIELVGIMPHSFENIKLRPCAEEKSVDLHVTIKNGPETKQRSLFINVFEQNGEKVYAKKMALEPKDEHLFTIELGESAKLWSPQHPHLYQLELVLIDNETDRVYDQQALTFGLRTIQTDTRQIILNGEPIFLTGYVDCCIFPQTGYPIWDKATYKKQFKIVKEYGFNHVRLHGWTPPKPFFEAADEEGILVQTELPHWGRAYIERKKMASDEVHQFLKRELERIITLLHTHPSFVMLSLGNELSSKEGHPQLNELVQYARELDDTRLYTDNTGFGELPEHDREGDFFIPTLNWHPPYHKDDAAHPDTTQDFREITRLTEKPMIAHEHGQFTTYVRPQEADKYQGVLQPNWLKTINETLKTKGLEPRLDEFIEATSVHMKRTLKEAMEKARRTPGLSGIQLLDIRDFAGQGHATVGVLDVFWDDKGIIRPAEFREFNDQTVLLMRSPQRTYFTQETLAVDIEVSHFGKNLVNSTLIWKLSDGDVIDKGEQIIEQIPGDGLSKVAHLQVSIPKGRSRKLVLSVALKTSDSSYSNQWDFWAFERPKLVPESKRIWTNITSLRSQLYGARFEEVIGIDHLSYKKEENVDLAITNRLSRDILQYIIDGGSVWLVAEEQRQFDEVHTRYLPIFWNYLWFPEQSGTTMGMIIHEHPLLKHFPHDRYANWHWYHLVNERVALNLELLPDVKPIIEVIDNFNRAKRLAYAFEFQLGKGKVFVSSLNITNTNTMKLPEVQQMLFDTINYLTGDEFTPRVPLTMGDVLGMFKVYDPFSDV